jgi:hypothetical protein
MRNRHSGARGSANPESNIKGQSPWLDSGSGLWPSRNDECKRRDPEYRYAIAPLRLDPSPRCRCRATGAGLGRSVVNFTRQSILSFAKKKKMGARIKSAHDDGETFR